LNKNPVPYSNKTSRYVSVSAIEDDRAKIDQYIYDGQRNLVVHLT